MITGKILRLRTSFLNLFFAQDDNKEIGMLSLLRKKDPVVKAAERAYAAALARAREPFFYQKFGVPDSFDGRFDLLMVHLFLLINRLKDEGAIGRDFNQALFDVTFVDMDQTLRESGVGDMGVPKHQKRMMKAFNGRMHAYEEALAQGDGALAIALRRNLYGTLEDQDVPDIQAMVRYINRNRETIAAANIQNLLKGEAVFAPLE